MSAAVALPGAVREQTARSVVRAAAFLRAGQLVSWLWVPVVYGIARLPPVVLISYLLAMAWTAVLFTAALRRNDVTTRWVLADVAAAVACAVIVSRAFPAGQAASPRNWVLGPICGAGVTSAFFASRWIAAWSVGAIAIAWMVGTWPDIRSADALVFSGCAVIVVFSLVAALAARVLFRAATQADQAASAALEAQRREAMAEARDEERRQQFKVLHDNVLHALESIARGELAIGSREVRETCMRDADYLRGLITGGADSIPTDLGVALAGMGRDRSALGSVINITSRMDRLAARGMVTYGTVKAAFAQLTRLLAVELAPSVRVNGIAPGVVETDGLRAVLNDELRARIISATPLHRLSTVADVANAARWLASPAASYVTGKVIEIDGGAEAPTFPDDTPDLRTASPQ